ncbi:polysaccharide biosynthesis protein [Aidingimonas lacisalsi]|uniref:polysaccharide biosynthesis protein n=1 Tax=Aidingimonas lacisalsi TaxID=2604086 RepID=UPI0011D1C9F5|nr:nucleoside-diphosphate sugar epimerase/dehydratase [Aidingimonas lacisalsi]
MFHFLDKLFRIPRKYKRLILIATDMALVSVSLLLAISLQVDSLTPFMHPTNWLILSFLAPVTILAFLQLGFYRSVIRFLSYKTLTTTLIGVLVSTGVLVLANQFMGQALPRPVPFIYLLLSMISIGGIRVLARGLYQHSLMSRKTRVVIYGAGAAGSQLVTSLQHDGEYAPIAFVDDWRGMHGTLVEGLKVHPPGDMPTLIERYGVARILLAIPSASRSRRRDILHTLEALPVPVQTVPGVSDIIAGRAQITELRDITIEDLLGRDPVSPNQSLLGANIRDKSVMVTGAGGSIGAELCRQIITQEPTQLLLLDSCEYSLYRIEKELHQLATAQNLSVRIRALLGSVQERPRLNGIMRTFTVQTIYHAAAYKHVPMVEHNMVEGIRNNVYGTLETARAAIDCGVETFVLVSTDKAVRPTNVMGTTKRLAELICQSLAHYQQVTRFSMVRFGNVLDSSGSVVPLFRQQIKAGGPVTVTHPDITRYFMTMPEAAQLVIQAGAMGRGGDVFVLDMGEPVKIDELARKMIRLSGMEVIGTDDTKGDIAITYSGLRPGEKLYEELLIDEGTVPTDHPRILSANEPFWEWPTLNAYLQRLYAALSSLQYDHIRELLKEAPTAYHPEGPIVDLICRANEASSSPAESAVQPCSSAEASADASFDLLKVSAVSLVKSGSHF